MNVSDTVFKLWIDQELGKAQEALYWEINPSSPNHYALANRALIQARSRQWSSATQDASEVTFHSFVRFLMFI